jgi:hypothetical protein
MYDHFLAVFCLNYGTMLISRVWTEGMNTESISAMMVTWPIVYRLGGAYCDLGRKLDM